MKQTIHFNVVVNVDNMAAFFDELDANDFWPRRYRSMRDDIRYAVQGKIHGQIVRMTIGRPT